MSVGDWDAIALVVATLISAGSTIYQARCTLAASRSNTSPTAPVAITEYSAELRTPQTPLWISATALFLVGIALVGTGLFGMSLLSSDLMISSLPTPIRAIIVTAGLLSVVPLVRLLIASHSQSVLGVSHRKVLFLFGLAIEATLIALAVSAIYYSLQEHFLFGQSAMTLRRRWALLLFAGLIIIICAVIVRVLSALVLHPNRIMLYDLALMGSLLVFPLALSVGAVTANPETDVTLRPGDHARVTDPLLMRDEPSNSSSARTVVPAGTVVLITGEASSNEYYPINWDGHFGYLKGWYLVKSDADLTAFYEYSATGNAIVTYAMELLGYPYTQGAHGPESFDAPGFTYWVIENVVGKDIGDGLWAQVGAGMPVSRSNLVPGDLVFFQNTSTEGLSHVGIYIGEDQFVHAQNEETGVVISDLNSNYYSSRWYGAVRIRE